MKLRILNIAQIFLFISIGAVGGHYQGLAQGTIWGYQQVIGDLQQKVELAQTGKK